MNGVFLDTNIIMELFFERAHSQHVLCFMEQAGASERYVISILSLDILFYYVEQQKLNKTTAHAFLARYGLVDLNEEDYLWAQANDQGDFEDALQVGCALRHGAQKFVTLDRHLKKSHQKHIAVSLIS